MPDYRRRNCRACKKHDSECGPISWRGLCGECGPRLSNENADALHFMRGPEVLRWRRGLAASVGAILPEDQKDSA